MVEILGDTVTLVEIPPEEISPLPLGYTAATSACQVPATYWRATVTTVGGLTA